MGRVGLPTTKKERKITAKLFIVAAQAHESARLLLNSANGYYPDGLANSSGELGKNLIFSAGGSGQGLHWSGNSFYAPWCSLP